MSNSSHEEEFYSITSGPFEFRFPKSAGLLGTITAVSWSYFLERNIPLTRGLEQRIRFCSLEFPRRLPTSPKREVEERFAHFVFPPYLEKVKNAMFYFFNIMNILHTDLVF